MHHSTLRMLIRHTSRMQRADRGAAAVPITQLVKKVLKQLSLVPIPPTKAVVLMQEAAPLTLCRLFLAIFGPLRTQT